MAMYSPASDARETPFGFQSADQGVVPQVRLRTAVEPAVATRTASALIDLIEEPLFGLSADGALLVANRAAWRVLDQADTLVLHGGRPVPVDEEMQVGWRAALADAHAGRRRLLWLRGRADARSVLLQPGAAGVAAVLVRLGRDAAGRSRLVAAYAATVGLTLQETRVLEAIVEGHSPDAVAQRHRVSIATVRTQIRNMTVKAGVTGMRELIADVLRAAA